MWICGNDFFLSVVHKDCPEGSLLVRARRSGDIEKVFGRRTKVTRAIDADYLYRAVIPREEIIAAMAREVMRIDYSNFKSSVMDEELHDAYLRVWSAMAQVQNPRPYSERYIANKYVQDMNVEGQLAVTYRNTGWTKLGGLKKSSGGFKETGNHLETTLLPKGHCKKNSKQRKKQRALIRKNGASIGTEQQEK